MRMQLVLFFLKVAPIAASLAGTPFLAYAAEVSPSIESRQSETDTEPSQSTSIPAAPIATLSPLPDAQDNFQNDRLEEAETAFETTSQTESETAFGTKIQVSSDLTGDAIAVESNIQFSTVDSSIVAEIVEPSTIPPLPEAILGSERSIAIFAESSAEGFAKSPAETSTSENFTENLSAETLRQIEPAQSHASVLTEDFILTDFPGGTQTLFIPIDRSDLAQIGSEHWQIAQTESTPESETPQPALEAEDPSPSPRWRFNITPNAFIPFSVNGRVTVRNFRSDLDLGLSDILDSLNFALAGRVEAWRSNLGLIFDAAYFDLGQDQSTDLSLPNCLCNILPSRIETDIDVQYGQFDLGFGYRSGTNLSTAETEFEMGSLVFDAILGIRVYAFEQEINISTNLGGDRNLQSSTTLITPLASGRIRWNVSPTLAGWVRGDFAGFGIGGTLFATSFTAGIDWLFAGNTSLLLAYRLSTLQYTADVQGEELGLNLLLHGPYLGVVFRF